MGCKTCRKKLTIWSSFGNLTEPKTPYCKKCWFKRLIREAKEDVKYWQKELSKLKKEEVSVNSSQH